jgi:hypothetical protein
MYNVNYIVTKVTLEVYCDGRYNSTVSIEWIFNRESLWPILKKRVINCGACAVWEGELPCSVVRP